MTGPQPLAPGEVEVQAFDHLGNPLCPGCWEGPLMWAARQNGRQGVCGCPAQDRRLPVLDTRAQAVRLLRDVVDVLDSEPSHFLGCQCTGCRARNVIARAQREAETP